MGFGCKLNVDEGGGMLTNGVAVMFGNCNYRIWER